MQHDSFDLIMEVSFEFVTEMSGKDVVTFDYCTKNVNIHHIFASSWIIMEKLILREKIKKI